jgi:integrase
MPKHKLWKRNGIYYTWVLGNRVSTGCRDEKAAQRAASELERAAVDPSYKAAHETSFGTACQLFKEELELRVSTGKRSAQTVEFYRFKLAHLVRVLGADRTMFEINSAAVSGYLKTRAREGAHPSSMNKELIALRQVLKYARQRGDFVGDIEGVMPIGFDHEYEPRETFLSPEQAWRLLAEFSRKRKMVSLADTLLLAARTAFFLATACRDGELARARREDVDFGSWLVTIRGTKTKLSARVVPVVLPDCRRLLVGSLMAAPERSDGLLFGRWQNPTRDLAAACQRAGVPRVTPNDLRRSHAHWLRSSGIDPALIGPVLGHVDSRMVERVYGRLKPAELREEIAKRLAQNQSSANALSSKDREIKP